MPTLAPMDVLETAGWVIIPDVVSMPLIEALRQGMVQAYNTCRAIQIKNGIGDATDGTMHHLIGQGDCFLRLLEQFPLYDLLDHYFDSKYILNSYGGVVNQPGQSSYVGHIHRDIRIYSGELPLMLNVLIMLDDFTLANGATYVLTGSHKQSEKPDETVFFAESDRIVGTTGSCLLFNSNLWHAAGQNHTQQPRRALTLTFTKPFIKPQFDYVRAVGKKAISAMPEHVKQLLGYYSQVPTTLEEWYQPPAQRLYQPGQDARLNLIRH